MSHYRLYSHAELVEKLEVAQREIARLRNRPDHTKIIENMQADINGLHRHIDELVEGRNQLYECLQRNGLAK